ncbi:MAG: hypothetical protein KAK00_00195 [Nanoarchaeota archaeon]|nr:hypothetical protein [Nanoarchaeota archaeon]
MDKRIFLIILLVLAAGSVKYQRRKTGCLNLFIKQLFIIIFTVLHVNNYLFIKQKYFKRLAVLHIK